VGASVSALVIGVSAAGVSVAAGGFIAAAPQAESTSVVIIRTAAELFLIFLDIFSAPCGLWKAHEL
jgi:hypothetical protein